MPLSFWLSLFVAILSFVIVIDDHGEAWPEFKQAKGRKKLWKGVKVFAIWGVAVVSLIATIALGVESRRDDAKEEDWEKRYGTVTNKLVNLQSEYTNATNALDQSQKSAWAAGLPRAQIFDTTAVGIALDGFTGKIKPNVAVLYPHEDNGAWQLASRLKEVLHSRGWTVSMRGEKLADVPPGRSYGQDLNAPVESQFGFTLQQYLVIANPAYARTSSFNRSVVVTNTGWTAGAVIFVIHTDNPAECLLEAMAQGGLGGGSGDYDPRLPLDTVEIVVAKKNW